MSYEHPKQNQFFSAKNNTDDEEPIFNIPVKVINLPYQTGNLNSYKQKLNRMETIREKETEYNTSEKTNVDISKSKLIGIPNNSNTSNQDLSTNIPKNFIPSKKVQSIKPFVEDINNFENDQLENTSDEMFDSEEESENIKQNFPCVTYNNDFSKKYNLYNLKLSINQKRNFNKNSNINSSIKKMKKICNSCKNNNINYLNYKKNLKVRKLTRDSSFNEITQNKYLEQINKSSKKKDKNFFSSRDKSNDKISGRKNSSCLTEKRNQNYLSVDLTKIDNFKSNKKKELEIKQKIKIRQIKSKQKLHKKKFLKKKDKDSLNAKFTESKNDYKLIIPRNQTDYGVEFSMVKKKFTNLHTFSDKKLDIKNNNNNINNTVIDSYQKSLYKENTFNEKSKSNNKQKNDVMNYNNNLKANFHLIKIKINTCSVKKKKSKKKCVRNKGRVSSCVLRERNTYQTNPFINDSINSSAEINENNNTTITKIISIVEKKLGEAKKIGIVNGSKKKKKKI